MEVSFYSFAETQKNFTGTCTVVDVCLDAMEKGMLPVVAEQWGYYLWEYFYLTTDQVARVCALLKRRRLPPCLLWTWGIRMRWTRRYALTEPYILLGYRRPRCNSCSDTNRVPVARLGRGAGVDEVACCWVSS